MKAKAYIPVSLTFLVSVVQLRAQIYTPQICFGGSNEAVSCLHHSEPRPFLGGTVVVGIVLSDGLVMAADSRLIMTSPGSAASYKVVSDSADKLFAIGGNAIATFGDAMVLDRSIASLVADFRKQWEKGSGGDIDELAKKFSDYFGRLCDEQTASTHSQPTVGFMLIGYDRTGVGKLEKIIYPTQREPSVLNNTHDKQGAQWAGQIDVISRLVLGSDPQFATTAPFTDLAEPQKTQIKEALSKLEYQIPWKFLTIQDGADLSLELVQSTVDMQRFSFGTVANPGAIPGIGGPVDVVIVTPFELKWVRKKELKLAD